MPYGTLSVSDLLATARVGASIIEVGEDHTWDAISSYMDAHNAILNQQLLGFVTPTVQRTMGVGGADAMTMDELDEFGRSDAQKVTAGVILGLPLRMYGVALQWTRTWLLNHTPGEMVAQVDAAMTADVVNMQRQIKRALFNPTDYTFTDKLIDKMSIPVKALLNADSMVIPIGPNGEVFDPATHTHYLARAGGSVAASDVSALVLTVAEHYNSGSLMLFINQAQEAAIRAMTPNFTPYVDARIITPVSTQIAQGSLNPTNIYNRAIGVYDGAEVWVKPWVPASYMFAWMQGQTPPLGLRERRAGSGAFGLDYEDESHPLRAKQMGREFGLGVMNRVNGAVLYTGNTTYAAPTL